MVCCVIRRAEVSEAVRLGAFAADLFREAYGPTHPEPALSRYLADSFAPEEMERRLKDPRRTFFVAETDAGEWCGYVELCAGEPDRERVRVERPLPGSRPVEIVRFYVAKGQQGRGVAQALMASCEGAAAAGRFDVIWLQAWEEAAQALRFYEKSGFDRHGTAVFPFGDRIDHDVLLAKPILT
jgi:ribosomal protein S18 acetylase RimI-like enzyme